MSDLTPDPGATFQLDQDAAESELATRDQTNWENHLEVHATNVDHARAMSERIRAQAKLWDAVATVVVAGTLAAEGAAIAYVVRRLVRR